MVPWTNGDHDDEEEMMGCAADAEGELFGLSYGEHLLVWALRRLVVGRGACPSVMREFDHACAEDGAAALSSFHRFVLLIAMAGRHRLQIGHPGCAGATRDERLLLTVVAAAQADARDRLDAHLRWLAAGWARSDLIAAAQLVGAAMGRHGHWLRMTPVAGPDEGAGAPALVRPQRIGM